MNTLGSEVHTGLIYLGILGLLYVILTVDVIRHRWKFRVGLGLGENNPHMEKVVRIHGNFAEHVPFTALLLLILEINHASVILLNVLWVMLVLSRVAHAVGLQTSRTVSKGRTIGVSLMLSVMVIASLTLIVQFFSHQSV
jgi:Uncharacterized relative of glutathione S-transferase, MAPEG superfamily